MIDSGGNPDAGYSNNDSLASTEDRSSNDSRTDPSVKPIAICGMACRLPGGVKNPQDLWDLLMAKKDARTMVPETRYNVAGYHWPTKKPGHTITKHGYFLDPDVDIGALDTSVFPMARGELEVLDPQQRLLLEVSRESIDDAGEVNWQGTNVGVYVGTFGNDWYDILQRDSQRYGAYYITTSHDFGVSNRVSHLMDLHGPSMTVRTACSSSLVALNEACAAIGKGDCSSAIVAGTSIIMAPSLTTDMSDQGTLSPDGSCNTFSTKANGYARGEGIVALFVKSLDDALRDGNPIRSVIVGSATNADGNTPMLVMPSSDAQEALIRRAYRTAGIAESDISKTGFFECHGTGTPMGDPIETTAIARVFGGSGGVHIGSIKPNVGHGEGVSGLTAILKAVLSLENQTIAPNIKCSPLSDKIPFAEGQLVVPTEAIPWPEGCYERVSVNSFGIGGSNAHVILDSPRRFPAIQSRHAGLGKSSANEPHLLLLSGSSDRSLESFSKRLEEYVENGPESLNLRDVAYTMARRRQQLSFRSFAVGTRHQLGNPSPPLSSKGSSPSVIMVFTGQGAQWPQMGRQLLRSNKVFRETIRSLDNHLQDLGSPKPEWKIEDELLKPARTSRVNQPEFSQPLCTALQIALVDTLTSVGISPAAVVGHSSGEMGAAYAAGGLSAREAIVVAFYRGLVSAKTTRDGTMAAVGLSWKETEEFLSPGVVLACDNSPRSVTISGDTERVSEVLARIKQKLPNTLTKALEVGNAYHSHHMKDVGEEYYNLMVAAGVAGSKPSLPVYSSVTGQVFETDGSASGEGETSLFGPSYWRSNLESPVLFNSAVVNILKQPPAGGSDNLVFVEAGPHSALPGPLRQILTSQSNTAPYVPLMKRKENAVETLLNAVGKLWTLHVPVNLSSLIQDGKCLPDLPRYPWNHQKTYWRESRVASEWRMNSNPCHDLLGLKVPESTTVEPVWRNLLHLDNAPWIRDHRIHEDIVFPFTGYVAMASEAVAQITGNRESVELRRVSVNTALVIREGAPTEIVTTLRRHRLTTSQESRWWDFSITAHNGHAWTNHCFGQVSASPQPSRPDDESVLNDTSTPHEVNVRQWYDRVSRGGLRYGHHFRSLEEIRTSAAGPEHLGVAKMKNNWHGDEDRYHLHPVVLDSLFQLVGAAAHHGFTHAYSPAVPVSVGHIAISRCSVDDLTLTVSSKQVGGSIAADGACIAGSHVVMRVSNASFSPLNTADAGADSALSKTARSSWICHIDFMDANTLAKPTRDNSAYFEALEDMATTAVLLCRRSLSENGAPQPPTTHVQNYVKWIQDCHLAETHDADDLRVRFAELHDSLRDGAASHAAMAVARICDNIVPLVSGQAQVSSILNEDGLLDKVYQFLGSYDVSPLLQCLSRMQPNLRILELRSDTAPAVSSVVGALQDPDGQPLYSRYVYADRQTVTTSDIRDRLKGIPNLEFANLDISRDPMAQGFKEQQFDLILAAGVLHSTPSLHHSLRHIHQLLSPDGRLILQQPREGLCWLKLVLGLLPGWWRGVEDNRVDEPYVDVKRWEKELLLSGYRGLDAAVSDSPGSMSLCTVMVARPQPRTAPTRQVMVLMSEANLETKRLPLETSLESLGIQTSRCTLNDRPIPGQDIIAVLETDEPFFAGIDAETFEKFNKWIGNFEGSSSGILWITRVSQIQCNDPRFALVTGLARTIRSEMGIDFAICEVDDLDSASGAEMAARVCRRFHERDPDLSQDLEFVISGGVVRVGRFFPQPPLSKTLDNGESSDGHIALSIGHPGRIDSLAWEQRRSKPLGDFEVEIDVRVVGLNFRDVLEAMGIIGVVETERRFGLEATGVVKRVGRQVTKVSVGDRVLAMGTGAFSTAFTTLEMLCHKLPDNLSFADGATMVIVFLTAIYALIHTGRLQKGMSVLIHSGCGGVGLASIQIAHMLGAQVYTTVGSEEKVNYLMKAFGLPRNRIFSSHSESFAHDILRETQGKGVDLALNSLSGELLHATWRCVAKWGTMVEIGKVDLLGAGKLDMDMFLGSRSYSCFDLRQMAEERPEMISLLLSSMTTYYEQHKIQPIPQSAKFPAGKVEAAFREMQKGHHIGKILVSLSGDTTNGGNDSSINYPVGNKADHHLHLDPAATYLLIGGLGGLGRPVSVWMVQHGARHLTYLSRSAGSDPEHGKFALVLASMGCSVQFVQGSVAEREDVARAIHGASKPVKGILHLGMVLRDQSFQRMTLNDWNDATKPKIDGVWHLHQESVDQGLELDFMILFSSLSGILGQPGQANYAAANTFLDAFAKYRKSMGLPVITLDIGAMEGVGYLAQNEELLKKMKGTGWNPVQEEELLRVLGSAMLPSANLKSKEVSTDPWAPILDRDTILVGLSPSSTSSASRFSKDARMIALLNRGQASLGAGSDSTDHLQAFMAQAKSDPSLFTKPGSAEMLAREIGKKLFALLLKPDDEPSLTAGLAELGLDSLIAVEMRAWWRQVFGLDISVLEMLAMGSLGAMGKKLAEKLANDQ
ncbi:unnamed protein product [Clonostachys chloroleuca]|uniref:Carrier domain-containing protein n=1 Tax=Clonostachys chloroleuca TaxID=1926264 RepID=A0AA35LY60_9HYPO|nr:unnamed protein product [Clonostachys chloroleuca]